MSVLVKDFKEGDRYENIDLLVNNVTHGVGNNGANYLNIELRDGSGTIVCKKWDASNNDNEIFVPGEVIRASIDIYKYKDSLQAKIFDAVKLNKGQYDLSSFIKQPPINKEILTNRFFEFINSIKDETCLKLLNYFIEKYKNDYFVYPAACKIHHEFSSGLLTHSVYTAGVSESIAKIYGSLGIKIDRDLLVTGMLLHDVGKIIELEGSAIFKYSLEGKLKGHISIMNEEIGKAEKELNLKNHNRVVLLQHIILAHHGELEYGSPVLPQTMEALIASFVDNLDSKIMLVQKNLEITNEGEFTQRLPSFDDRSFYKN